MKATKEAAGRPAQEARVLSPEAIIRALRIAILTADLDERVTFASGAALRMLRRSEQDCLGQPLHVLIGMTHSLREHDFRREGAELRLQLMVPAGGGRFDPMMALIVKSAPSDAEPGGYVCALRPSPRIGQEEAARQEPLIAVTRAISAFADEVKNPLAAVKLLVENLLAETAQRSPAFEPIRRLDKLVRRIEALVRGPLVLGRVGSPEAVACDPNALVEAAALRVEARFSGKGVHLARDLDPSIAQVRVAEADITQALVALLENALEASDEGSTVTARSWVTPAAQPDAGAEQAIVTIAVEDQGPGISSADLARIFDPNVSTKPKHPGLGLSIALKLVRDSGGRIVVRSTEGVGSEFRIEMPAQG